MAIQHHVNAANAATIIMVRLSRDLRLGDLSASKRQAMRQEIFKLSDLVDELERRAEIAVKPKARVWFLRAW